MGEGGNTTIIIALELKPGWWEFQGHPWLYHKFKVTLSYRGKGEGGKKGKKQYSNEYSSVAEYMLSMGENLGSILSTEEKGGQYKAVWLYLYATLEKTKTYRQKADLQPPEAREERDCKRA